MAVAFEKVARAQLFLAVVARKVLWMPGLAERCDNLADNWLITGTAAALLQRIYSLLTHVGAKLAKHRIQLVTGWREVSGHNCCGRLKVCGALARLLLLRIIIGHLLLMV